MKNRLPQTVGVCCLVGVVLATTSITAGQVVDTLVKAKALYAEASYDEALAVLKGSDAAEAYQYRALCFIALGKTQDAEHAIESLINAAPGFAVSDTDLPPRLVTLFAQTRRRVMPGVVKRLFTEARADFQARNLATAREKFEKVLALSHDPAISDSPDAADLQLLVGSYIDILKNSAPPAPLLAANTIRTGTFSAPIVTPSSSAASAPITPAAASTAAASNTAAAPPRLESAARPAAPVRIEPSPSPVAAVAARALTPATTVRQNFPPYEAPANQPFRPVSGAVRVTIGVDGRVTNAVMEIPIDPRYDSRLVKAAKSWLYKPAMLGGQAIQSEKVVQINIAR